MSGLVLSDRERGFALAADSALAALILDRPQHRRVAVELATTALVVFDDVSPLGLAAALGDAYDACETVA